MKILPTKGADLKLFLVSIVISLIFTFPILTSKGFVPFLANWLLDAIIIMIVIRVVIWLAKKIGLVK